MLHWYDIYAVVKTTELLNLATEFKTADNYAKSFIKLIKTALIGPGCVYTRVPTLMVDFYVHFPNDGFAKFRWLTDEQSILRDTKFGEYAVVGVAWESYSNKQSPTEEHPDWEHFKALLTRLQPMRLLLETDINLMYSVAQIVFTDQQLSTQYLWGQQQAPNIWDLPDTRIDNISRLEPIIKLPPTGFGSDTISFDPQDPVHFALFNTQNLLETLDAFCTQDYISLECLNRAKTHLEHLKHFPKVCYVEGLGGNLVVPLRINTVDLDLVIDFNQQVFLPYLPYLSHLIVAVHCSNFNLPQQHEALNTLYAAAQLEFAFLQPYNQSPFTWTNDDARLLLAGYGSEILQKFAKGLEDVSEIAKYKSKELRIKVDPEEVRAEYVKGAQDILIKRHHPLTNSFFWREDGDPHPPFWSYTQSQHIVLGAKLAKHLNLGNGVYWPTASEAPHIHQQLAQVTVEDIFEVIGDFDSI